MVASLHIIFLITFSLSLCVEYKVGVLLPRESFYTPSLKRVISFAAGELTESSVSISLVHQEYDRSVLSTTEAACTLLESNVTAVISVSGSAQTAIEAEIFSQYNISFLSVFATNPFLQNGNRDYLMMMSPSDRYQAHAIYHLLKHFDWKEFSILASADSYGINGVMHLQDLVSQDSSFVLKNVQYFHPRESDPGPHLQVIKDSLSQIIILNCFVQHAKQIFQIAKMMGLMEKGYAWIVTDAITRQQEEIAFDGAFPSFYNGIIGIIPSIEKGDVYNTFKDDYVINNGHSKDDLTTTTLMAYDAVKITHKALEYAVADGSLLTQPNVNCSSDSPWEDGKIILDALRNVSLEGVTGSVSFTDDGISTRITYDIMNFREVGFVKVGSWTKTPGLSLDSNLLFLGGVKVVPSARPNTLSGRHLRLGIVEEPPLAFKVTANNCTDNYTNPDCWYGFCPELNKKLSEDLNFTFEYVEPDDNKYGGYHPDGESWNGMIGDILGGKIDLTGTALAINAERETAITFSFPFTEDTSMAIIKGTSQTQNKFFFLSSFHTEVWFLIFCIGVLFTILINLFNKLSPLGLYGGKVHAMQTCSCSNCIERRDTVRKVGGKLTETKEFKCLIDKVEDSETLTTGSLLNTTWIVSTGFVGQNPERLPKCASGRFLLFSWWCFVTVIGAMYTANLTAYLTLKRIGVPIDSIKDLPEQTTLSWGVIADRNTESRLLNHVDGSYDEVVSKGIKLKNLEEAIEKVRAGGFAFIDESSVLAFNFQKDCDMVKISNEIQSNEWAYGIKINSPYTSVINRKLLQYREQEYFTKLKKTWYGGRSSCRSTTIGSDTPFDKETLSGLFYTVALAVLVCCILIIMETVYAAYTDTKMDSKMSFSAAYRRRFKLKFDDILHDWVGHNNRVHPCEAANNNNVIISPVSDRNANVV